MIPARSLRWLVSLPVVVLLLAACSDTGDEIVDATVSSTAAEATTTTTTAVTTTVRERLAIDMSHSQAHPSRPFVASGPAIDEGVVCPSGISIDGHSESMNGELITDEDWARIFDEAMATDGVAEAYVFPDWICNDGSGMFTLKFHNRIDFALFEFEGQQGVGTWEIVEGTDMYADLAGSGGVTLDWDAGQVAYTGEIRP